MAEHQHWGVEALWQELEPLLPGISIEVLARVDSTNNALLERVRSEGRHPGERSPYGRRANDLQPCLLVAEHQTHGRGRMGRSWHSSATASLTFSLALPMALTDWSGLSLAVGAALADALDPPGPQAPRLQLKWPNDIWLDGRKLGGILIETVPAGSQRIAIIGIGLNIAASASPVGDSGYQTGYASLDELLPGISAPEVLKRIARPLIEALLTFAGQGYAGWQPIFARRDLLQGQAVTAGTLEGVARGTNARGELLLETPGGLQTVAGGEVSVRLLASANAGIGGAR